MKVYLTPELKQPDFLAINRNGIAPVIEDPNTDLVLGESGAIMDYLLDQYDTDKRISFTTLKEQYQMKQWLQLQTTTQGPLLQHIFHWSFVEQNPTARAGYVKDFRRILHLLDDELTERQWLVSSKYSTTDLRFVAFHSRMAFIMTNDAPDVETEFPHVDCWYKRMVARHAVKTVLEDHQVALSNLSIPGEC